LNQSHQFLLSRGQRFRHQRDIRRVNDLTRHGGDCLNRSPSRSAGSSRNIGLATGRSGRATGALLDVTASAPVYELSSWPPHPASATRFTTSTRRVIHCMTLIGGHLLPC
jgi:hypothetical protein